MQIKQKIKKCVPIIILMLILSLTCVFYNFLQPKIITLFQTRFNIVSKTNNLLVHFIDVGQGDAIAVNLPNDKVLLIDAGTENKNVTFTNYIKEHVLNSAHDNIIDYLILTHADADHIGGTLRLLKNFKVNKIFMPIYQNNTQIYLELKNFIENNCNYETISRDIKFNVAGCEINILGLYEYEDTNKSCPVVKMSYLNKSFLFTADIPIDIENLLINEYGEELNSDVLKIAHHGSNTSTSSKFLSYVTPEYSVISVGQNSYGHPTQNVLNNINNSGSALLRTDVNGSVMFSVGKNYNLTYNCDKYLITSSTLDYRFVILVLDVVLILAIIKILIKKKNKHKTK